MSASIDPNHPRQKLLFFVAQDLDDSVRNRVRDFVVQLGGVRAWLNGPPCFVDSRDEPAGSSNGDLPIETVGGYLEIYTAWPPWKLPREIDLQHFDEVSSLIDALCNFSRENALAFEFELDGTFVGAITDGEMDRALSLGLLGEWRAQLFAVKES